MHFCYRTLVYYPFFPPRLLYSYTVFLFQITDLHISYFTDPERTKQLSEFCLDNLKAINPELVLVSGTVAHLLVSLTKFLIECCINV